MTDEKETEKANFLKKMDENKQGSNAKSGFSIKIQIGEKRRVEDDGNLKEKISRPEDKEKTAIKKVDKTQSDSQAEKKLGVASVFREDSDSEEEEMPKEAKMRMRNIGRDTPTSAGPNSFNKGKHGFVNQRKLWEQSLKPRTHLESKPPPQL